MFLYYLFCALCNIFPSFSSHQVICFLWRDTVTCVSYVDLAWPNKFCWPTEHTELPVSVLNDILILLLWEESWSLNTSQRYLWVLVELSCKRSACSGAPWIRKFVYLCIQEILVLTKSSVHTRILFVRTSTPSCKSGWNFAFQVPLHFVIKLHSHPDF